MYAKITEPLATKQTYLTARDSGLPIAGSESDRPETSRRDGISCDLRRGEKQWFNLMNELDRLDRIRRRSTLRVDRV